MRGVHPEVGRRLAACALGGGLATEAPILATWGGGSTPGMWTKRSSMSHLSAVSSSRRSVSCIDTAVDAWFCAAPMAAVLSPSTSTALP